MMSESISEEIMQLREEIDLLWDLVEQSGIAPTDGERKSDKSGKSSRGAHGGKSDLEFKLGLTGARMMRYGWRSAVRPWLDSSMMRRNVLKSLGIGGGGLVGGFLGGLYGVAVSAALDGIAKLFKKKRSELIEAREPEKINYVLPDSLQEPFSQSIESEFVRGHGSRLTSRENAGMRESLERQLQRGVVGL